MRCPDCNKFVSFEEQEPEVDNLEISEDGQITGEIRIVNACAECSNELTESSFEIDVSMEIPKKHTGEGHDLEIEDGGCERISRSGYFKKGEFVPASGRYAKTFYGFELSYSVKCSCGEVIEENATVTDEVQASGMDALV